MILFMGIYVMLFLQRRTWPVAITKHVYNYKTDNIRSDSRRADLTRKRVPNSRAAYAKDL